MVAAQTSSGIVVEEAEKLAGGERAGLQAGDIILQWHRGGTVQGEFLSPFDLSEVEIEQAPLGTVTIEGLRGTEKKLWVLGPSRWSIEARPNLLEDLLSIYEKARELEKLKKPVEAAKHWQTAANLSANHDSWIEIWCLWQAVKALDSAGQWPEADSSFQQVLEKAALLGPKVTAQLMRARAFGFNLRSDWSNAEKYYQQSLMELGKSRPETLQLAQNLDELGVMAWKRGDLDKAESYFRQSLSIRQELAPDSLPLAGNFANLALVFSKRGSLAEAEDYHDRALAIELRVGSDKFPAANTLSNLGVVAWQRGDLSRAEKLFRESLAIKEKLVPDSVNLAATLTNLGIIAKEHGDLSGAEYYQQRALQIEEQIAPGSLNLASTLNNLGTLAFERGNLVQAEKYHQRALLLQQQLAPDSLDTAASLNNLGNVFRDTDNPGRAQDYFEQALAIERKSAPRSLNTADTLILLAGLARMRNNWPDSEMYYRQALSIIGGLSLGSTLHAEALAGLASVMHHKQQLDDAQQLYEKALTALEYQLEHFGGTGDFRAGFRSKYSGIYKDYIELLLAQGQSERALEILERSRAQSLLELLGVHINTLEGVDQDLLRRERSLREQVAFKAAEQVRLLGSRQTEARVASAKKEMDALLAQYHDVREEILTANPAYAALAKPRSLKVEEIQQLLDPETLLLEYSLGEKQSHLWAVTSTSFSSYELPGRRTIEELARGIYAGVAGTSRVKPVQVPHSSPSEALVLSPTETTEAAGRDVSPKRMLAQILWQHLSAAELNKKRWLIVADGALQYLPFNILPRPTGKGTISSDGDALISTHEIAYLPSASVLAVLRHHALDRKQHSKLVAVLADPVFDNDDPRVHAGGTAEKQGSARGSEEKTEQFSTQILPQEQLVRSITEMERAGNPILLKRLMFSRWESRAIVKAAPHGQAMEALDFDANRTLVTNGSLAGYRIVHFATHGLLNNEHPELSGLVFSLVDAQGKTQNGFLDLEDIYNLRLQADLVVLSACETGLGKEVMGEGLIGLARGFMYAGATRVIASLWKVDDVATAELMGKFYQGIFHDRLSPAAALRRAQLYMMRQKRWADPFYWAGFILEGEFQPLE